jgi:hypothetical protein
MSFKAEQCKDSNSEAVDVDVVKEKESERKENICSSTVNSIVSTTSTKSE